MKTLRAKVLGGSLRNSASSLAVFYVEQVALNRHVSPQPQRLLLCLSGSPMSRATWNTRVKRSGRSVQRAFEAAPVPVAPLLVFVYVLLIKGLASL